MLAKYRAVGYWVAIGLALPSAGIYENHVDCKRF